MFWCPANKVDVNVKDLPGSPLVLKTLGSSGYKDDVILTQVPGVPSVNVNTPMSNMIQQACAGVKQVHAGHTTNDHFGHL